ncbi:periplasmic nitrate reductase, NapE protein [Simiduia litorea]|uniref:periplasmic nitrate reductase, NapE protein n=1 Tax=Simiduia litorea TaxID=1435348 RepID=UPI0036F4012B
MPNTANVGEHPPVSRREERYAFFALAFCAAPIASVIIVGGYGFIVWISQILSGPPSY